MSKVDEIKKNIGKGLYVRNLEELTDQCMEIAKASEEPIVFYILASIFHDILKNWEDRPLLVEEVTKMEQRIIINVNNVIDGIIDGKGCEQLWTDLNSLLRSFIR